MAMIQLCTAVDALNVACGVIFDGQTYRGFDIRWTGLKGSIDSPGYVGQWLAYNKGYRRRLHLNVPNMAGGEHTPGQVFDIGSQRISEQEVSDPNDRWLVFNEIMKGRDRLFLLIDELLKRDVEAGLIVPL